MAKIKKAYLGIDVGSASLNLAAIDCDGRLIEDLYHKTKAGKEQGGKCGDYCNACSNSCGTSDVLEQVSGFADRIEEAGYNIVGRATTGSQTENSLLGRSLEPDVYVSELMAHIWGTRSGYPDCNAIIEVGGQDGKGMVYDEKTGNWHSSMTGVCSAGTGSFLEEISKELEIPIEEMGKIAKLDSKISVSATCAVFGKTAFNRLKSSADKADLAGGVCNAQAGNIYSIIGSLFDKAGLSHSKSPIAFQGGVAANEAVKKYLEDLLGTELIVPEYNGSRDAYKVMGAIGAALLVKEYKELNGDETGVYEPVFTEKLKGTKENRVFSIEQYKEAMAAKENDRKVAHRSILFPSEVLYAMDITPFTPESSVAAVAGRDEIIDYAFKRAKEKGYPKASCSFLRGAAGLFENMPEPDVFTWTTLPCKESVDMFKSLARKKYGKEYIDRFFLLELPTDYTRVNFEYVQQRLKEIGGGLSKVTGRKLDEKRLKEALENTNKAREYFRSINEMRMETPEIMRHRDANYALMFSQGWGTEELVNIARSLHDELGERQEYLQKRPNMGGKNSRPRVVFFHLPPYYSRDTVNYIESMADIVVDETNHPYWHELDTKDPFKGLAEKLMEPTWSTDNRLEYHRELIKASGADGAILHAHGFGHCPLTSEPTVRQIEENLAELGKPLLVLEGDCIDRTLEPCSTPTKIKAFIEGINLRKYGNIFGIRTGEVAKQKKSKAA